MLCDKKVPIKLNDKVHKTVIKPTMTHRAECWAVRKKVENRLNVVEMRMLRWIRAKGKTRKDHVRNQVNTRGCESMPNVNIPETEILTLDKAWPRAVDNVTTLFRV